MSGLIHSNEPRVLLVDGDRTKRKLRTTAFRNCEIAIEAVESVREAVNALTLQRFDLVLLAMRQDSAARVCSQLRKIAPQQRIGLLVGPPDYVRDMAPKSKIVELALPRTTVQVIIPQCSSLHLVS